MLISSFSFGPKISLRRRLLELPIQGRQPQARSVDPCPECFQIQKCSTNKFLLLDSHVENALTLFGVAGDRRFGQMVEEKRMLVTDQYFFLLFICIVLSH